MSEITSVDVVGFDNHYIIIDHTDNSGLSVSKPTENDIKLFKQYGSFTLHANAAATAETRVNFLIIN